MGQDIKGGEYQVVISSIESMTAGNKLRPALASTKLSKRRQLLVVDEAHVPPSRTETGFRPVYAITGQLCRLLPPGTPVLAATATANQKPTEASTSLALVPAPKAAGDA
ncbi:hypothetical protein FRC06_000257 [Ceratobasidium sp. 370]|nr:hypothetical protein FRC06_000257 [Ceratobasidium sp. 370]